jgi:hypothetical protein
LLWEDPHNGRSQLPGFDGIDYETLRAPIVEAFRLLQHGPAATLQRHTQKLADQAYWSAPLAASATAMPAGARVGVAPSFSDVEPTAAVLQPLLFEEFEGIDFKVYARTHFECSLHTHTHLSSC